MQALRLVDLQGSDADLAPDIDAACRECGLFQVVGHTVVPRPGALVINIGDLVQVRSNDRYPAPEHRVLASAARERYSAPYFFNPTYTADCAPLFSPPRYRPVNWGEFRAARVAGDYADIGEEVQISHYATTGSDQGAELRYGFR